MYAFDTREKKYYEIFCLNRKHSIIEQKYNKNFPMLNLKTFIDSENKIVYTNSNIIFRLKNGSYTMHLRKEEGWENIPIDSNNIPCNKYYIPAIIYKSALKSMDPDTVICLWKYHHYLYFCPKTVEIQEYENHTKFILNLDDYENVYYYLNFFKINFVAYNMLLEKVKKNEFNKEIIKSLDDELRLLKIDHDKYKKIICELNNKTSTRSLDLEYPENMLMYIDNKDIINIIENYNSESILMIQQYAEKYKKITEILIKWINSNIMPFNIAIKENKTIIKFKQLYAEFNLLLQQLITSDDTYDNEYNLEKLYEQLTTTYNMLIHIEDKYRVVINNTNSFKIIEEYIDLAILCDEYMTNINIYNEFGFISSNITPEIANIQCDILASKITTLLYNSEYIYKQIQIYIKKSLGGMFLEKDQISKMIKYLLKTNDYSLFDFGSYDLKTLEYISTYNTNIKLQYADYNNIINDIKKSNLELYKWSDVEKRVNNNVAICQRIILYCTAMIQNSSESKNFKVNFIIATLCFYEMYKANRYEIAKVKLLDHDSLMFIIVLAKKYRMMNLNILVKNKYFYSVLSYLVITFSILIVPLYLIMTAKV